MSASRCPAILAGLLPCFMMLSALPAAAGNPRVFNSPESSLSDGTLNPASSLGQFILGELHRDQLVFMAAETNAWIGRSCGGGSGEAVEIMFVDVLEPLRFTAGRQTPVAGLWTERFTLAGCGPDALFNVMIIPDNPGGLGWRELPPGETTAGFQLVMDAIPAIGAAAMVLAGNPPCNEEPVVPDTRVLDIVTVDASTVPGSTGKGTLQSAIEEWTVVICGHAVNVGVTFTEDGQGGAFYEVQTD